MQFHLYTFLSRQLSIWMDKLSFRSLQWIHKHKQKQKQQEKKKTTNANKEHMGSIHNWFYFHWCSIHFPPFSWYFGSSWLFVYLFKHKAVQYYIAHISNIFTQFIFVFWFWEIKSKWDKMKKKKKIQTIQTKNTSKFICGGRDEHSCQISKTDFDRDRIILTFSFGLLPLSQY